MRRYGMTFNWGLITTNRADNYTWRFQRGSQGSTIWFDTLQKWIFVKGRNRKLRNGLYKCTRKSVDAVDEFSWLGAKTMMDYCVTVWNFLIITYCLYISGSQWSKVTFHYDFKLPSLYSRKNKWVKRFINKQFEAPNKKYQILILFLVVLGFGKECVRRYKIALNLGIDHSKLLISLHKFLGISSFAWPAPRFRAILYRQTHSKVSFS